MKKLLLLLTLLLALPSATHAQTASYTFSWTAVGDDSLTGTAGKYDMRWSTTQPNVSTPATKDAWWLAATPVTGLPVPLPAGAATTVTVPGIPQGVSFWVLRVGDEIQPNGQRNWSGWSNVLVVNISDAIPPAPPVIR
jgi:hypothetical protein